MAIQLGSDASGRTARRRIGVVFECDWEVRERQGDDTGWKVEDI